jgi:hypothetical protein
MWMEFAVPSTAVARGGRSFYRGLVSVTTSWCSRTRWAKIELQC